MKRLAIAAALIATFAVGIVAQDAIFPFHGAFKDTPLGDQPCVTGLKGPASMTVYDTNAWIVYTCSDDRVILRRYFNPNDNATKAVPVIVMPTPAIAPTMPVCPAGMVNTLGDGTGCVPPNHPLARK